MLARREISVGSLDQVVKRRSPRVKGIELRDGDACRRNHLGQRDFENGAKAQFSLVHALLRDIPLLVDQMMLVISECLVHLAHITPDLKHIQGLEAV